jgi:hypothetical protein
VCVCVCVCLRGSVYIPIQVFMYYPNIVCAALTYLPASFIFSILFFLMILLLGIDSSFAIVEVCLFLSFSFFPFSLFAMQILIASLRETVWFRNMRKELLAGCNDDFFPPSLYPSYYLF